jgi:threonyl-tRNA synthetase
VSRMQCIEISLPDGKKKSYEKGITSAQIAADISLSLHKKALGAKVNSELFDLQRPIYHDAMLEIITSSVKEGIDMMRHTAAHVLAQAVKRLYGDVKLGGGPVIENGFYYDMDVTERVRAEDLVRIEQEMKNIVAENLPIERLEVSREQAQILFQNDNLKLELLQDIPAGENITLYRQGEFVDLCRGPHLPSTGALQAFRLTHVAGAYWRGDSDKQVLQRIYGIAFATSKELESHLVFLEEAAKRNHRKLGNELELFMFSEEAPGMPFYLPKGQLLRNKLEAFLRGVQEARGYQEVRTPFMMNRKLWENSGHWDHYKENMYFSEVDNTSFAMKPMNCPGHMLMFKHKLHSYRELPIRMAEFGQVHRHEYSGALNGLLRVRTFCQDDAHIFATPEQIEDEIQAAVALIDQVYRTLGFKYEVELSTRPENSMGEDSQWEKAEQALQNVLEKLGYSYRINEGDGAFYGPKIDFHIKDALHRSHQCGTVQLDFQMPQKFDLHYVDAQNQKQRPVVIHRAVFGSIDRFLGIMIEHFAGAFPLWLAPVQVKIIPVSHIVHAAYAKQIESKLQQIGIRVELDVRAEKLGYRVREAQIKKIPYIIVVGDQEAAEETVNARKYGQPDSVSLSAEVFVKKLVREIEEKVFL